VIDSILMLGAQQQVGTDKVQASCGLMVRQDMTEVPLSKALNPQSIPRRNSKNGCPLCVHPQFAVCVFSTHYS